MPSPVIVVGAGPAGLATGAELRRAGIAVRLVERGDAVGTSWRQRYDGLRLNTVRWLSQLPGYRLDRAAGRWVDRDQYVAYLDRYRHHHRLDVATTTEVTRIRRGPGGWTVATSKGDLEAPAVVIASGAFDRPVVPDWPGLGDYRGDFGHAATFRNAAPYRGRHVLVVGGGASGLEIALLLADGGARRVDLSVRAPVHLFPRQLGALPLTPVPASRWLAPALLDLGGEALRRLLPGDWPAPLGWPAEGLGTAVRHGVEPVVADGVVEALRSGRIGLVAPVTGFTAGAVRLADSSELSPDSVLAATGYRSDADRLLDGVDVFDRQRHPVAGDGSACPGARGLAFVGFAPAVSGRLPQVPNQARRAARTVRAVLDR